MNEPPKTFREAFAQQMPTREQLAAHPWLARVAHVIVRNELWHMRAESVARGVAVGMFWAFVVPFAQIIFAAAHCVWWRANIPVAAAITFITNPFTVGFWLWLAYQVGSLFIAAPPPSVSEHAGWLDKLGDLGAPTLLGMGIFAIGGAMLGYLIVKWGWRARVAFKRRRRLRGARPGL
jgi:uncharacterized protein